jgi:hypothetical protein
VLDVDGVVLGNRHLWRSPRVLKVSVLVSRLDVRDPSAENDVHAVDGTLERLVGLVDAASAQVLSVDVDYLVAETEPPIPARKITTVLPLSTFGVLSNKYSNKLQVQMCHRKR